ncbi:glycosyltransferase family 2 protein [Rubrivirga sp. IMCC45206]|uniref:glycosyltransferase family 2 protein n=1 Tax=Rubrivirga sp. IMCC45206 TaxID=3391614 RepID=UPI00399037B1
MTAALLVLGALYAAIVAVLAGLGLHALGLAAVRAALPARALPTREPDRPAPAVLVQLPVYDEPPALVARALDAALALDWPGPVTVQLLDDSPPEARRANAALCAVRPGARHVVRGSREGYKAGALAFGLGLSDAPFVAVFDVDFRPAPDLLRALVGPLLADPELAFVQSRWAHAGADRTVLARAQAAVLDLHFAVEQTARDRAGWALPFNGSGGAWRRAAIDDAGGWSGATLAEDADLALRAQARGWRGRLHEGASVAADLPETVAAWRRQQARWAKGLAEVARLHIRTLWRSPLPLGSKLAFSGHLALSLSLPSLLALIVLHPVVVGADAAGVGPGLPGALAVGYVALGGVVGAHVAAMRALYPRTWRRKLVRIPAALVAPVGLVVPAAQAVAQAVAGRHTPFARTPKGAAPGRERALPELVLAAYSVAALAVLAVAGAWAAVPFQAVIAIGTVGAAAVVRRPAGPVEPVTEAEAVSSLAA